MAKTELTNMDIFGISASSLCAIHCMATPLVLAVLPTVAGEAWESPLTHQIFAGMVALFCGMAAYQGFRKHADWKPLVPLAVGLLCVIIATFFLPEDVHEVYEMPILCFGSLVLVIGHVWNLRKLSQCCKACPSDTTATNNSDSL